MAYLKQDNKDDDQIETTGLSNGINNQPVASTTPVATTNATPPAPQSSGMFHSLQKYINANDLSGGGRALNGVLGVNNQQPQTGGGFPMPSTTPSQVNTNNIVDNGYNSGGVTSGGPLNAGGVTNNAPTYNPTPAPTLSNVVPVKPVVNQNWGTDPNASTTATTSTPPLDTVKEGGGNQYTNIYNPITPGGNTSPVMSTGTPIPPSANVPPSSYNPLNDPTRTSANPYGTGPSPSTTNQVPFNPTTPTVAPPSSYNGYNDPTRVGNGAVNADGLINYLNGVNNSVQPGGTNTFNETGPAISQPVTGGGYPVTQPVVPYNNLADQNRQLNANALMDYLNNALKTPVQTTGSGYNSLNDPTRK